MEKKKVKTEGWGAGQEKRGANRREAHHPKKKEIHPADTPERRVRQPSRRKAAPTMAKSLLAAHARGNPGAALGSVA